MLKTVRFQVLAALAAIAVVLLLVGGIGLRERRRADLALESVTTNQLPSAIALGRLSSALVGVQLQTRVALIDLIGGRRDGVAVAKLRRDDAVAAAERAATAYASLPLVGEEARLWHDVQTKQQAFRVENEQIWAAILAGDAERAREHTVVGGRIGFDVIDAVALLVDEQSKVAKSEVIATAEAQASSTSLLAITMAFAAVVLVAAARWMMTSIAIPVATLTRAAAGVAEGDLDPDLGPRLGGDLGGLREGLASALGSMRATRQAMASVARGELHVVLDERGGRDALAAAVNETVRMLRDAGSQADVIASGDYRADVRPRSDADVLGVALQKMTKALRDMSSTVQRLATGDVSVVVTPRGEGDLLGVAIAQLVETLRDAGRQANVIADGDYEADIAPRSPADVLGVALQKMTRALRVAARASRESDFVKTGVARVNDVVLGQSDPAVLARTALSEIATHVGAKVGAMYVADRDDGGIVLRLLGSYAYTQRKGLSHRYRLGEGVVGQVALERKAIVLADVPDDYVRVTSGLGDTPPRHLAVMPMVFKGELRGVLELGLLGAVEGATQTYLDQVAEIVATALEIAEAQALLDRQREELRANNDELTSKTRALESASRELEAQQAELEQTNAELEAQMQRTLDSEARLKIQQRELEVTNAELEGRNVELERQKAEIEKARREMTVQAEELAIASKYKSEFLANMSHELRTPLNSLLLLARSLRDNPEGNLSEDQRESAGVIFSSGNDLLNLINEILDLSKIEAGRMDLRLETVEVADVCRSITRQFDHMAKNQGLTLDVVVAPECPPTIVTDATRLGQVLKNLVGNALKFTERGGVSVTFGLAGPGAALAKSGLAREGALAIRVKDTGIGIPLDKQKIVFEAFQQADSGDRRRFGGTGLGLSISRELAMLLGGEIGLVSEPGVGSTFTVYVPLARAPQGAPADQVSVLRHDVARAGAAEPAARPAVLAGPQPVARAAAAAPRAVPLPIADDRDAIEDGDRVILIVEDDVAFAKILVGEVRRRGFKCVTTVSGGEGVTLAKSFRPSGVVLDLNLPDTSGWAVLTSLKQDVETRHIPVHIVSAEEATLEGFRIGAIGHAHKPLRAEDIDGILATIEKSSATAEKLVLVVEDDPLMRRETVRIIGNGNVHAHEVATGAEALEALRTRRFDLMVLDLGLPDMQGLELLKVAAAEKARVPPVIVYTVRELTPAEELALRQYADSIIIKDVRSQERLIDEVALFLHRVVSDLPEEKRRTIRHLHDSDEQLRGKKVLIVEDDMRTMFAMAKLLASHGINPLKAANGEQALKLLTEQPDVDLVLLDMMMPVLDGYETARRLRSDDRFVNLPVIALTAKAMKEDRQRCMEAGATDYLTKPVDQDRLVSLLRVWLCR